MLARTRLRKFAIAALEDESAPWGPDCECIGPIAVDCDGSQIEIMDSPEGYIIDRLTDEGKGGIGLPAVAIYADEPSAIFDGNAEPCLSSVLTLTIEIYTTGEEDWQAETNLDELNERVMYRLLRQDQVAFNGEDQANIWAFSPSSIRTRTERQKPNRRIWMRQIEITLKGCDTFHAPICDPCGPVCVNVMTPADCC